MFVDNVGQGAPGGNRIFMTVWDGGGDDTYNFMNYTNDLTVDLRPGRVGQPPPPTSSRTRDRGLVVHLARARNTLAATSLTRELFNGDTRSLIENAVGGIGNDQTWSATSARTSSTG